MGHPGTHRELLGSNATISTAPRNFVFRYRSPEHWLEVFKTFYGPVLKTFAALRHDLLALIERFNRAVDGSMAVPSEVLEIVIIRH